MKNSHKFKMRRAYCLLWAFAAAGFAGCSGQSKTIEQARVVPVTTATQSDLEQDIVLTAEFIPYQDVDLMAKVAGYVRTIHVDIGDHVREGQLLATLEVPEMQDEVAKAESAAKAARSDERRPVVSSPGGNDHCASRNGHVVIEFHAVGGVFTD